MKTIKIAENSEWSPRVGKKNRVNTIETMFVVQKRRSLGSRRWHTPADHHLQSTPLLRAGGVARRVYALVGLREAYGLGSLPKRIEV